MTLTRSASLPLDCEAGRAGWPVRIAFPYPPNLTMPQRELFVEHMTCVDRKDAVRRTLVFTLRGWFQSLNLHYGLSGLRRRLSTMHHAHVQKIQAFENLNPDEQNSLSSLCSSVQTFERKRLIISEGQTPTHVHVMLDGWAARFGLNARGGRRITAFLLPGDFSDIHATSLKAMDHGIVAITDCSVGLINKADINQIMQSTPALTLAFQRSSLVDAAILRQWLVNAGRKDAFQTVGHLLCELQLRLQIIGKASQHSIDLPLTQEEIGDATGLTSVHVNRTFRKFREIGLVSRIQGGVRIPDIQALRKASDFDPFYLHLK